MQRIEAGTLGGRKLLALPDVAGLRPTASKVRGAIFDRLGERVLDARVLDLFAGSGAMAFEALSRGARMATLCESQRALVERLRRQAQLLGVTDRVEIEGGDALRRLSRPPREPYDLVFVDPPYDAPELIERALERLVSARWLVPDAVLVSEHATHAQPRWPRGLAVEDARRYGQTAVTSLRRE